MREIIQITSNFSSETKKKCKEKVAYETRTYQPRILYSANTWFTREREVGHPPAEKLRESPAELLKKEG